MSYRKDDGSRLRFVYDPLGNRWAKMVVRKNGTTLYDSLYVREYMIRDAGGNELALYRHRQQYNEQKVAGDIFTPNNTPVPISGQAPIRGSLQRYKPGYGQWEEVGNSIVGTGGSLHFDMAQGLPAGVPLKLVVTTDVGRLLHLDNMSYGRYQSDQVYDEAISEGEHSAFAGSVNLPLAPLPAELTLASGATSVSLNVSI